MGIKDKKQKKFTKTSKNENEFMEEEPMNSEVEVQVGGAFVFIISCVIYYMTMFPGLPMGDSGEFMVTGMDFGVAHPPGYPLFTTMTYLVINLIPFGTPAWRVNLLSVFFGAIFNLTVYYTVSRIGKNCVVGLITACWTGFSRLFWMWSIQGEIFSLNNFFCASIMLRAYFFEQTSREKLFYEAKLSALVCGLSLSNQHTSVLFIFPFSLRVAYRLLLTGHSLTDAVIVALYGIAGMACYIQMPISQFFFAPRVSWGDFSNVNKFLKHMLRLDYGSSFKLVAGTSKGTFLSNFVAFIKDSSSELSLLPWVFMTFLFYTIIATKTSHIYRSTITSLFLMMICYLGVFCSLANINNPEGLSRGVLERFWMQPSIVLMVFGGVGLCKMVRLAAEKVHPMIKNKCVQLTLGLLIISVQIKRNYQENDESSNWYAYHYAQSVLPHLPQNSIMLSGGDLPTNVFRYHTICEQIRPDVKVLDMQFMSASWFRDFLAPDNFAQITIPGVYRPYKADELAGGEYNLKQFLDANIDRFSIFVCNNIAAGGDREHVDFYASVPFGTCKQFRKRSEINDPVELLESTPGVVLFAWPMPDLHIYEDRTWEHTLMKIYLSNLAEKANFLWHVAAASQNPGNRRYALVHGLRIISNSTSQVEMAISQGKFDEDVWKHLYSSLAKTKGHICMILHSMKREDNESPETLEPLEACVRKYWQIFVDWAAFYRKEEEIVVMETLRNNLDKTSFKGIKFTL